jgi:hypothetical protein
MPGKYFCLLPDSSTFPVPLRYRRAMLTKPPHSVLFAQLWLIGPGEWRNFVDFRVH